MTRTAFGLAAALALAVVATPAFAADGLPAPVNGVTFDEWAAGNARIVNNQPLADVLKTLGVDEAKWKEASDVFVKALKDGGPGSRAIDRYGEVFANPAVGRFMGQRGQPEIAGKLATFEDYAKVQAHLTVGVEAGVDPQEVLKEHGLTVYQWSQESRNWVQEYARIGDQPDFTERMQKMNSIRENFEASYRARYKLDTNEKF